MNERFWVELKKSDIDNTATEWRYVEKEAEDTALLILLQHNGSKLFHIHQCNTPGPGECLETPLFTTSLKRAKAKALLFL